MKRVLELKQCSPRVRWRLRGRILMRESQRRVVEYRYLVLKWGVTFECIAHDVGNFFGELENWYGKAWMAGKDSVGQ